MAQQADEMIDIGIMVKTPGAGQVVRKTHFKGM